MVNGKLDFKLNIMEKEIPDELVKIAISNCNICNMAVRVGVEHKMDKKDFYKEVVKYNLSVTTISLKEYQNKKPEWCKCKY